MIEVSGLSSHSPDRSCDLDPIPTTLLTYAKLLFCRLLGTNIINLSLSTGIFPDKFKNCSVHPKLTKHNLDKENLSNYRPISLFYLSFISKLTERLVKNRLTEFLNQNNLFNSFQLYIIYTKFNNTETTLLLYSKWLHNQSHRPITSHWSLPTWSFGRRWHYWSFIHSIIYNASIHGSESTTLFYPGFNHISLSSRSSTANNQQHQIFSSSASIPQGSVLGWVCQDSSLHSLHNST